MYRAKSLSRGRERAGIGDAWTRTVVACAMLMAILLMLPAGSLAQQTQEKEDNGKAASAQNSAQNTATHEGEFVAAKDVSFTMTIDGKNTHTHQLASDAKITLNGKSAQLSDLNQDDAIRVTTPKGDRGIALAVAAKRPGEKAGVGNEKGGSNKEDQPQTAEGDEQETPPSQPHSMLGVFVGATEQNVRGVRVLDVMRDGPAERAGLQRGDFLLRFNGQEINEPQQLSQAVDKMQPGEKVELTVWRNGRRYQTEATLTAQRHFEDGQWQVARYRGDVDRPRQEAGNPDDPWLGVLLREVEEDDAGQGALVGRVFPNSPASRAGLRDGDRIMAVGDKEVDSAEEFVNAISANQPGDQIQLRVNRPNRAEPITLNPTLTRRGDILGNAAQQLNDPVLDLPEAAMRLEHERRMARQHERIEGLVLEVLREVRQLRDEVDALKAQSATQSESR